MSYTHSKKLLNKDFEYCDLLGGELFKECIGSYTHEELNNLKDEDCALGELKRTLRNKVGNEETDLESGIKPSSAAKVNR